MGTHPVRPLPYNNHIVLRVAVNTAISSKKADKLRPETVPIIPSLAESMADKTDMDREQMLDDLLTENDKGQELYADSAYVGLEKTLEKYGVKDQICERGYRGHPLTDEQKESNGLKSKTRNRVEHVFGFMECVMNKLYVRTIGLARAASTTGMFNLVYNMCRYEQIVRLGLLRPEK